MSKYIECENCKADITHENRVKHNGKSYCLVCADCKSLNIPDNACVILTKENFQKVLEDYYS